MSKLFKNDMIETLTDILRTICQAKTCIWCKKIGSVTLYARSWILTLSTVIYCEITLKQTWRAI